MGNSSETNWEMIDALTDEMIDRSELAPLDDSFFDRATWRMPEGQAIVTAHHPDDRYDTAGSRRAVET